DRLSLVVRLLPFGQTDRNFDAAVFQVHAQRHERHSTLDGLSNKLSYLLPMQQQLPPARRFMIAVPTIAVGADVHVVDPDLAGLDPREAVAEVHAAFAD